MFLQGLYLTWNNYTLSWRDYTNQGSTGRLKNRKLLFYNTIKMSFGYEQFLNMNLSYNEYKKLAQFRSSSHRFNIETGRHGTHKRNQVVSRICDACSTDERDVLDNFAEMPSLTPLSKMRFTSSGPAICMKIIDTA